METEENCIENQINGFKLRIRLAGQTLRVIINCRQSGKKYQSELAYQTQSDNFKFAFGGMQQAFQHIKDELTAKSGMIKISDKGKLQIGSQIKQKIRFLLLEIQEVQLQQSERLIQAFSFLEKDVKDLKTNVDQIDKKLDGQQQENMLKMKQWLRRQINDLKQQLFGAINLKSDVKETDQKLAGLKQQLMGVFCGIEKKSQIDISMAQAITEFDNLLSRDSKKNQEKLKEANTKIQELTRQVKQLGKNSELQILKHIELEEQLKKNRKDQAERFIQMRENQNILKIRLQEQAKKFKLAEILLSYKFPKMMESCFVRLTVDYNIGQFKAGFFQAGYFKMINDRMFQKVDNALNRQVVSKEQLPRKGKYYFQVLFHYSSDTQPKFVKALVGIVTQNLRQNENSFYNKQSVSYTIGGGYIWENGSGRKVATPMYSRRGLVTVVVDADQRMISWYYDHQFQASTTISSTIMDKKIYALVDVAYQGTILQFKS